MSSPQSINAAKASTNANNDALVQDILSNYIGLEILHPVIQNMSEDPNFKAMFWKALGHDYAVIGNRSQDLSDCEITATQKAFKKLMDDKNHVAAVEIYVDEIIGINTVSENLKAQCLATAIQTRDHIMSLAYESTISPTRSTQDRGHSDDDATSTSTKPHDDSLGASSGSDDGVSRLSSASDKNALASDNFHKDLLMPGPGDAKMKRLFDMYRDAKTDFYAAAPKSLERTKAAKFLRDTTENCLNHIALYQRSANDQDAKPGTSVPRDGVTFGELKTTLKKATEIAEKGSGGKKRRFDEDSVSQNSGRAKTHTAPPPTNRGYHNFQGGIRRRTSPPQSDCYRPSYR